eukprot:scaffold11027_cov90-Isochrysis_galbana.AAC.1
MHARALHIPPPLWVGGSKSQHNHNHISGRKALRRSVIPVSPEADLIHLQTTVPAAAVPAAAVPAPPA